MAGGTKDRLDRLEERTERIEQALGRFDDVLGSFEKEAAPSRSVCVRLEDQHMQNVETRGLVEVLITKVQELTEELSALKEAGVPSGTTGQGTMVKFPEPSSFSGVRDAKELENFLWDMDQYLIAAKIPKREQVPLVGMYLSGDAKL
ncbi:Tropomyosin domain-containing protein [Dioscorea alata]|uniref:Tropomyosin domain-containing protein n=1 Tax=Dioscorea alata TaxID=55571 RepID=A0ACB7UML7_DIOAL|nr:Tropomyosin domain-containing protein [Dioscorea alata]